MPAELPPTVPPAGVHTPSLFDLSGKTALVTGANGGIGGGMARGLAEAGADIVIFQIPGEVSSFHTELSGATGRRVYVYDCDLGDSECIRRVIQRVFDDGLTIDILCNVAGISSGSIPILHETDAHKDAVSQRARTFRPTGPVGHHDNAGHDGADGFRTRARALVTQIIQTNFNSVWVLSQCVARHMVDRKQGGKIINIGSLAAHRAQTTFSVYGPMKAAVGQLTNSFANEFGPYNIQVNAIYPG